MSKVKNFMVGLAAAGFLPQSAQSSTHNVTDVPDSDSKTSLFQILKGEHTYTLAGHRSHSSHSSHGSHRSSSGGGFSGISPSRPLGNSTPPSSVLPRSPQAPRALSGNSQLFLDIAKRVQVALQSAGYYTGAIDGIVGSGTRAAIAKYQRDNGLEITGTITSEVLDALNIIAN